ncbi:alpha/beta fold hydrolase [Chloroflexota bacterium]
MLQELALPTSAPEFNKPTYPVLFIAGEFAEFSGPDAARVAQQVIPGSKVRILPTGHCSAMEQPQVYNEAVIEFLSIARVN